MSFIYSINRLSYGKIISIAIFLALIFGVPATVLLIQQQTKIASRAYKKPEQMISVDKEPFGPIPAQPLEIGRAFPWVGKIGDIIWLQGKNFGNNPAVKSLKIGGIEVKEDQIIGWRDDQIQAIIPAGARQGGVLEVKVGHHPASSSLPMVIYDQQTKIKLAKRGNIIIALNGGQITKVKAWTGDENTPTEMGEGEINAQPGKETPIFDTEGKPLLTLLLFDRENNILPYYVDPTEFGF